ncbi:MULTISPECIES: SSI family serine proteinase inhibitor [unclassified Streptomyces]|uniref:SSI family serine proteinase inhibitor n=1 Tax=unclassified Streptomyces TaxID=2593676 RepID=UPI0023667195|nr:MULTISPECIES: SSI family serine proteinase inhibitor [unclassified Streptomyces]MDF3149492.1 SSI family serine proteinase inhibitor [Streptomyces sp. T21Q-yed]WDF42188.1 SSI family serine proteinase inhibitor [Streptomyces sp. T12]
MTRCITAVRGALLTAAAALALGAAAPQATAQDSDSGNWLFVTVTRGDAPHGEAPGRLLLCDPPQGHRKAAEACEQLDRVGGDIGRLQRKDAFCPMIYAPVTAHARGEWNGRSVEYRETFSNGCGMSARTGAVFALDG